jgi:formate/nitrite transporter
MIASLFEKKISITAMLKNWIIVFFGNFIGSVLVAIIIVKYGGLLDGAVGGTAIKIANAKINFTPHGVSHNVAYFFRAIGCNWLVCLAVLMAIASKDITGKIFAIFFPIMAFVASGFEHSIANMYFLSAGIFAKSFPTAVSFSGLNTSLLDSLNWVNIWSSNLIVVTLGNLVGGGFFVATFYYFINRK